MITRYRAVLEHSMCKCKAIPTTKNTFTSIISIVSHIWLYIQSVGVSQVSHSILKYLPRRLKNKRTHEEQDLLLKCKHVCFVSFGSGVNHHLDIYQVSLHVLQWSWISHSFVGKQQLLWNSCSPLSVVHLNIPLSRSFWWMWYLQICTNPCVISESDVWFLNVYFNHFNHFNMRILTLQRSDFKLCNVHSPLILEDRKSQTQLKLVII